MYSVKQLISMTTAITPQTTQNVDERWTQIEEFLNVKNLRLSTRRSYETWLRNFSAWTAKPWQEITHDDIAQYCAHLAQQKKPDRWSTRINASLLPQFPIRGADCSQELLWAAPTTILISLRIQPMPDKA